MKIQKWVTKLTNHYLIKIHHVSKSAIFENIKSIFIGILSKSAVFDRQRKNLLFFNFPVDLPLNRWYNKTIVKDSTKAKKENEL